MPERMWTKKAALAGGFASLFPSVQGSRRRNARHRQQAHGGEGAFPQFVTAALVASHPAPRAGSVQRCGFAGVHPVARGATALTNGRLLKPAGQNRTRRRRAVSRYPRPQSGSPLRSPHLDGIAPSVLGVAPDRTGCHQPARQTTDLAMCQASVPQRVFPLRRDSLPRVSRDQSCCFRPDREANYDRDIGRCGAPQACGPAQITQPRAAGWPAHRALLRAPA